MACVDQILDLLPMEALADLGKLLNGRLSFIKEFPRKCTVRSHGIGTCRLEDFFLTRTGTWQNSLSLNIKNVKGNLLFEAE